MTGAAEKPGEAGGAKAGAEVGHAAASPERVKTKKNRRCEGRYRGRTCGGES